MQLRKKPEKYLGLINRVWTRDPAILVQCSNQLTYEATDVVNWSIMCSYVSVKEMNVVWTRDLAILVQGSNQLRYEATDVTNWSIMCSYVHVKEMNVTNVCEINYM